MLSFALWVYGEHHSFSKGLLSAALVPKETNPSAAASVGRDGGEEGQTLWSYQYRTWVTHPPKVPIQAGLPISSAHQAQKAGIISH